MWQRRPSVSNLVEKLGRSVHRFLIAGAVTYLLLGSVMHGGTVLARVVPLGDSRPSVGLGFDPAVIGLQLVGAAAAGLTFMLVAVGAREGRRRRLVAVTGLVTFLAAVAVVGFPSI